MKSNESKLDDVIEKILKKFSVKDKVDQLSSVAYTKSEGLHEGELCLCGTKHDAFETALKLWEQMVENDCTVWAAQVSSAMQSILMAVWAAKHRGIPESCFDSTLELAFLQNVMRAVRCNDEDFRKRLAALMINIADDAVYIGIKDQGLDKYIGNLSEQLKKYPNEW